MRLRREDDRLNLYIDVADALDPGTGKKNWTLNLPKNLSPEDFIGAIMTVKEEFMDVMFAFDTVMYISVGSAIMATTSFETDGGVQKLALAYMPADGTASVALTTAS